MHGVMIMRDERIISKELIERINESAGEVTINVNGFDYHVKSTNEKIGVYYLAALRLIQHVSNVTTFDVENITAQITCLDNLIRKNEVRGSTDEI